LYPDHLFA